MKWAKQNETKWNNDERSDGKELCNREHTSIMCNLAWKNEATKSAKETVNRGRSNKQINKHKKKEYLHERHAKETFTQHVHRHTCAKSIPHNIAWERSRIAKFYFSFSLRLSLFFSSFFLSMVWMLADVWFDIANCIVAISSIEFSKHKYRFACMRCAFSQFWSKNLLSFYSF